MLTKLTVGLVGTVLWAQTGDIRGQILITKALSKKRVTVNAYAARGAAMVLEQEATPVNELSRVVIFLDGPGDPQLQTVKAVINQRHQQFSPEMLIIPAGSSVEFPNSDPFFHNVFSLSRAKSFDLGYFPAGKSRTVRFGTPGVVQVYCHLHPNMSAAIVVAPTAWAVQPDESGRFLFRGVPAGPMTLVAWHKSGRYFRKTIEVPADGTAEISIHLPVTGEGH